MGTIALPNIPAIGDNRPPNFAAIGDSRPPQHWGDGDGFQIFLNGDADIGRGFLFGVTLAHAAWQIIASNGDTFFGLYKGDLIFYILKNHNECHFSQAEDSGRRGRGHSTDSGSATEPEIYPKIYSVVVKVKNVACELARAGLIPLRFNSGMIK